MIRDLEIAPVLFKSEIVGYSVSGIYRDCSDSFWEPITHKAIFRTIAGAERLLMRIKSSREISFKHWNIGYSWEGCYSVLRGKK